MPDTFRPDEPGAGWTSAFAALPLEHPPTDGWARVAARLDAGRRPGRWPLWLATAAALVLAIALPWKPGQPPPTAPMPQDARAGDALADLYAESARLETLLAYARDERVSSGSAAALGAQLDDRIAAIDAALAQPGLGRGRQQALWRERVATLRELTGFESTRRWLSAQGERYDGALARVD